MVEVKEINVGFSGLFATADISKKSVIIKLQGDYLPFPTQTSIEIMKNNHIEDVFGRYINHHCSPNSRVLCHFRDLMWLDQYVPGNAFHESVKLRPILLSERDIKAGHEITIDYNDTEYEMATPFLCDCHGKHIKGRKYVK